MLVQVNAYNSGKQIPFLFRHHSDERITKKEKSKVGFMCFSVVLQIQLVNFAILCPIFSLTYQEENSSKRMQDHTGTRDFGTYASCVYISLKEATCHLMSLSQNNNNKPD